MKRIREHWRLIIGFIAITVLGICIRKFLRGDFPIRDFSSGVIGMAAVRNADISAMIRWYYLYLGMAFVAAYCFSKEFSSLFGCIKRWGNGFSTRFKTYSSFHLPCIGSGWIVLLLLLDASFSVYTRRFDEFVFVACAFMILRSMKSIRFCWTRLLYWLLFARATCFFVTAFMGTWGKGGNLLPFVQSGVYVFLAVIIYLLPKGNMQLSRFFYSIVFWLTSIASFELLYWLSFQEIHLPIFFSLFFGGVACFFSWMLVRRDRCPRPRYVFLLAVVTSLFLLEMRPVGIELNQLMDILFEGANSGLAVADFVSGKGIPLIDNLDAHLFSNSIWGLLYHAIWKDSEGAIFCPWSYLGRIISKFFFCFALMCFWGRKRVLVALLILPVFLPPWTSLFFGLLLLPAFLYWRRKPIIRRHVFLSVLIIVVCLWSADVGIAYGGAALLSVLFTGVIQRNWKGSAQFFLVFLSACIVFLLCATALILLDGHSLMGVISRFVTALASSQNWGYGALGEMNWVIPVYFCLPIIFFIGFWGIREKKFLWNTAGLSALFLVLAYVLNAERTVVRHSLIEGVFGIYPALIPSIAVAGLIGARNHCWRTGAFSVVIVAWIGVLFHFTMKTPSAAQAYLYPYTNRAAVIGASYKVSDGRAIRLSPGISHEIEVMRTVMNRCLFPGESYIDFSNTSLLYAFLGLSHPAYVNQSPAMVNGRKGQEQFLEDMENFGLDRLPLALSSRKGFWLSIDGVANVDRYGLIADFLNAQYRPIAFVADFIVWGKRDRYDELHDRLACVPEVSLIDDDNSIDPTHYTHPLGYVPYLLGEKGDLKTLVCVDALHSVAENLYRMNKNNLPRRVYLTFAAKADSEGDAVVQLFGSTGGKETVYQFRVKSGNHFYRIFLSSDMRWPDLAQDSIQFGLPDGAHVTMVSLEYEDMT